MNNFIIFLVIVALLVSAFIIYAIVHAVRFKNKIQDAVIDGAATGAEKLVSEYAPKLIDAATLKVLELKKKINEANARKNDLVRSQAYEEAANARSIERKLQAKLDSLLSDRDTNGVSFSTPS